MPSIQTYVAALSSTLIPGHHGPPVIITSMLVYLASLWSVTAELSAQRNARQTGYQAKTAKSPKGQSGPGQPGRDSARGQGRSSLNVLLTGVPSTRSKFANLTTIGINILLVLATFDFILRGNFMYPTADLAFSRVGYVSPTTAKILIREPDPAQLPLHVSYQEIQNGQDGKPIEAGIIYSLDESTDYTYPVSLTGLQASTQYRYSLSNKQEGEFTTAPTPGSESANRLTFLTSSCIKPNFPYNPFNHPLRIRGVEILSTIVSKLPALSRPSFMLFLGDFIYIDVPFRWGSSIADYRNEYRRVYSSPSWRMPLDPAFDIPWLHTLDDHEIANDWHEGNTTPPYPAAVEPYHHYHTSVNPPIPDHPFAIPSNTTYFSFTNGPASFFLVDTRTYRSDPLQPNSTMLGSAQLASLLDFISRPEPPPIRWKIITSSVPFTKNWQFGTEDTWGGFLGERRKIFDTIWRVEREQGVRVVLLSGDRHEFGATRFPDPVPVATGTQKDPPRTELLEPAEDDEAATPGMGIHEFCTGPLNMFYLPVKSYWQTDEEDVVVKYLPTGNVKLGVVHIDVDGMGRESVLTYCLYVDGKLVWKYRLATPLVWEREGGEWGRQRRLPPGEVVFDRSEDSVQWARRVVGDVAECVGKRMGPWWERGIERVRGLVMGLVKVEVGEGL
ncbi:hypothetical protein FQN52_008858 [Onygenales sp. PD_12]|nr:hypothetical protein FQN52_008858 [Onygenales sp. PD_12]KAK2798109.1 hypothetical protein FQN51_007928 [Onygenales sp. PD_10]